MKTSSFLFKAGRSNVLNIARKEFADLLSNRYVLLVVLAFLVYVIAWAYGFYNVLNGGLPGVEIMFMDNPGIAADNFIFFSMTWFGTILGIVIGCSTISSERISNALSILATKPVYRDTIINGKIIGSLAFLVSVIIFFMFIYTSIFFGLCGSNLAPYLYDYFSRLPFIFLFVLVTILMFLSLSMLISLMVKDQAFAMILSTLTVYVSLNMSTIVSHNVDNLLPGYGIGDLLDSVSSYSQMWSGGVQHRFMDTGLDAWAAFDSVLPDFLRLLLFVIIVMALNYIVFVKRDIV